MRANLLVILLIILHLSACVSTGERSDTFTFTEKDGRIELHEGPDPVFVYQKAHKSPNGEVFFNNYIHPLYSLCGDTLTEEFPSDHLHHRGIFWAWHQIFIDTMSMGDGWMMEDVSNDIVSVQTSKDKNRAQLVVRVLWNSSRYKSHPPFLEELTTITVHRSEEDYRIFDFSIALTALFPDVWIGGSDDVKGYGGFSTRIKTPDDLVFTSQEGAITPQTLQLEAGSWMDFSGSLGNSDELCGLTILCHPSTPNYEAPWILRQHSSMQNIVFPGRDKVLLSMGSPTILRYRMILHDQGADSSEIVKLQSSYITLLNCVDAID
jgi:hypothetical protein